MEFRQVELEALQETKMRVEDDAAEQLHELAEKMGSATGMLDVTFC